MKINSNLAVLVLGFAAAANSRAAAISNVSVTNNSGANVSINDPLRLREFRTEATVPASGAVNGNTVTLDSRFAWMSAHRVNTGGPTVALLNSNLVAYDLLFTVEDPLNQGYTLAFDSVFRGYLTAKQETNTSTGVSSVFSSGTLMGAHLDTGSGFGGLITALTTTTGVANATAANPLVNLLVSDSGHFDAGSFSGTRSFVLRFTSVGSNTVGALQNFNTGEADVRFGLDPTLAGFTNATYPGLDGESIGTHGHFVTVSAVFGSASEVPEPATIGMVLVGFSIVLRRWSKSRTC